MLSGLNTPQLTDELAQGLLGYFEVFISPLRLARRHQHVHAQGLSQRVDEELASVGAFRGLQP